MRTSTARALLLFATYAFATGAWASPWQRPLGSFDVTLSVSQFTSDAPERDALSRTGLSSTRTALSVEGGLGGRFVLKAEMPFTVTRATFIGNEAFINRSFGDGRVTLWRGLFDKLPSAVGLELGFPLYRRVSDLSTDGLTQVGDTVVSAASFAEVGDGKLEVVARASVGHSFYPSPSWFTAEVAYAKRFGPFPDAVSGAVNLGTWFWANHVGGGLYAQGTKSLFASERPAGEWLTLSAYVLGGGIPHVPWLGLSAWTGFTVLSVGGSTGFEVGLSVSVRR